MKVKKWIKTLSVTMAAAMITVSVSIAAAQPNDYFGRVNEGIVARYYAGSSSSKSTAKIETTKMYVTGIKKNITLKDSDEKNAKVLAQLKLKDEVEMIDDSSETCYYVYYKTKKLYGYIKKEYLTEEKNAVCKRQDAYISKKTPLYATNDEKPKQIEKLEKNSAIFIVSKNSGDYWFVYSKSDQTFGYVKSMDISTSKSQSTSSKSSSSKSSSTTAQSNKSSGSGSSGYYTGYSTAVPKSYIQLYAYVETGYLAIRSAKAYDASNELGKIYTNQAVFVVDQSTGKYWYCYSPTTKMYGYVNSDYLLSNDEIIRRSTGGSNSNSGSYTVWTVGNTGGGIHYLALRNAPSFNSANEIGKLYDGDTVYVYSNSYSSYYDTYWYVYSPKLGKWGYVNSDYIWS